MLDSLCLWIGRVVFFGGGSSLIVLLTAALLILFWKKYGQFMWFKFKHLFPRWWKNETWYQDYTKTIAIGKRPNNRLTRKGQMARLYCGNYPMGTRVMFIWIKK